MRNEEEEKKAHREAARVYLQVENSEDDSAQIDLLNIIGNMARRRQLYRYLFAIAICIGLLTSMLMTGALQIIGNGSYAQAVMTLQFEGIESGLDPNGAAFDINKLKSPLVIEEALTELGITGISVEEIRKNIEIEGVVPEDAVERLTVIQQMAEEDAANYEKILDVEYFPSQYIVSLHQGRGMSASETREILNAVLESYRAWFMDTYANTAVLTVTGNLLSYQDYDYAESVDMLQAQIDIMQDYVTERRDQAPDFRSAGTGLSFGDIVASLETIESIDMANLASYIENNVLTKDRQRQIEYYNYKIKNYTMELSELQTQLTTVQNTLDTYAKDPVVIVSSQETTQEISQTNEYYDSLVQKKIDLSGQIAEVNTQLNETYTLLDTVSASNRKNVQSEYDKADGMLERLTETISEWAELIEETTQEYYSTTLFSNAVKIAVPAQYKGAGGIAAVLKRTIVCVGAAVAVVAVIWCADGLRMEVAAMRKKEKQRIGE
ncbi:MAG: hypothetical protein J6C33_04975 [Lachnospiraceae bacterium]|nr:hypothetical protein [Lachnospiraceae bacterium]